MDLKSYCIKEKKEYLLKEWDKEKNNPEKPETVSHSSKKYVWGNVKRVIRGRLR